MGKKKQGGIYDFISNATTFADHNNFCGVWLPERHFHPFGALFPNPAVLAAALSLITQKIRLRAGSIVLPINNTVRIAERWSMVDNLVVHQV